MRLVLLAMHIWGGQPSYGAELHTVKFRNSLGRDR